VAAAALDALARREHPGSLGFARTVLEQRDEWRLRRTAVGVIAGLDDERAVPLLVSTYRTEPVPRVRAAALAGLARRPDGGETAWQTACEALYDPDWMVRDAAARALGQRRDARAAVHLDARLQLEANPFVLTSLEAALAATPGG